MYGKDLQDTEQTAGDDALLEQISHGIAEVLTAEEIDATSEEQVVLATEVVEQFISPLMIQEGSGCYITSNSNNESDWWCIKRPFC